jgi:hypothetical protein
MVPIFSGLTRMHAAHVYHNDITVLRLVYSKSTHQVRFVHFKKGTPQDFEGLVQSPRAHPYWPFDYFLLHAQLKCGEGGAMEALDLQQPQCAKRVNDMLQALSLLPVQFKSADAYPKLAKAFAKKYAAVLASSTSCTVPPSVRADIMSGIDVYMMGIALLEFLSRPEMFGNDTEGNSTDSLYLLTAKLGMDMAQLDVNKRLTAEEAEARLLTIRTRFCGSGDITSQ